MVIAETPSVSSPTIEVVDLRHRRRESALAQLIAAGVRMNAVCEPEVLLATLQRTERLGSSALGKGVALPHARSIGVTRPVLVLGRSARGVEWDAVHGAAQLVLLVLSPGAMSGLAHATRVGGAAHALRLQRARQRLLESDGPGAIQALREELA